MRRSLSRSGGVAGAVLLACSQAGAEEAGAQARGYVAADADPVNSIKVFQRHLEGRVGRRMSVTGRIAPVRPRRTVLLQIRRGDGWSTLGRARSRADGRYAIRLRPRAAHSARARIRVPAAGGARRATRRVGRLDVFRVAAASWYGPGLFGNRTGCGGTLTTASVGVAHKSLPCGTRVTLRHGGRTMRVPVIDRGPYVGNREYDLTRRVARTLGFEGHGPLLVTR